MATFFISAVHCRTVCKSTLGNSRRQVVSIAVRDSSNWPTLPANSGRSAALAASKVFMVRANSANAWSRWWIMRMKVAVSSHHRTICSRCSDTLPSLSHDCMVLVMAQTASLLIQERLLDGPFGIENLVGLRFA